MIGITMVSIAQESNVESQRRGWNVPRGEREYYGFGRRGVEFRAEKGERGKEFRGGERKQIRMKNRGEKDMMTNRENRHRMGNMKRHRDKKHECPTCKCNN